MRNRFDTELDLLHNQLIEMGALIENAIQSASCALLTHNADLAREGLERDYMVDEKEKEIERRCLKLILQQQPVAADLRMISTALKMITDMERIGDQAQDICELTLRLTGCEQFLDLQDIKEMSDATIKMVTGSIDAFIARDLERAKEIIMSDDIVDDLFIRVKDELVRIIRENSALAEQAVDLLMIAKYFERIGDHATNIAGWVVFSMTGRHGAKRVI